MVNKENTFHITRKGVWPILKYEVRSYHGHYSEIYIDDDSGGIAIHWDQDNFYHRWGIGGREDLKLRSFLVRASRGYLEDKFSYGLSRWDGEAAIKELKNDLIKKYGEDADTPGEPDSLEVPTELYEMFESLNDSVSSDAFYASLYGCSGIEEMYPDGFESMPNGDQSCNKQVHRYLDRHWDLLVDFWKAELATEQAWDTGDKEGR